MRSRSARRIVSACILSAATAAVLVAPGAASAVPVPQCVENENIHGKGSSAQKNAQNNQWNTLFNTSANVFACNGTQGTKGKPKATYLSTGSGIGLESWGVETEVGKKNNSKGYGAEEIRFGPENAFIGTEIAPNAKQETEITGHGAGKVLTIPVLQAAVSIIFHLPKGCKEVVGGPVPGRIGLKDSTVEKVFRGADTKWSQVLNKAKFVGTEPECKTNAALPIKRAVREDGSGTTDSFMKWLGVINKNNVEGTEKWGQVGEHAKNTTWPEEGGFPVVRGNGGGGVATAVATTPGTIGYANVSDARSNGSFTEAPGTGGKGTATFWGEVERNTEKVGGKNVAIYSEPATNGESNTKGSANCA